MSSYIPEFYEVERTKQKASIVIEGLSGKGKSGLALLIAWALTNDFSKVYAIDTEKRSLNLFKQLGMSTGTGVFDKFRKVDLLMDTGFSPSTYIAIRNRAIAAGAEVLIQDSITHAWTRKGGVLDIVEEVKSKGGRLYNDNYRAWGHPDVVKEKELIYEMFRDSTVHVISTVRVKEKQEMVTENGKTSVKSLGEQQIFMPETKYEPDLVIHMLSAGHQDGTPPRVSIVKSRYAILREGYEYEVDEQWLAQLKAYLDEGVDPAILLEQQRLDYIAAIKDRLDTNNSAAAIWPTLKEQQDLKDKDLDDFTIDEARKMLGIVLN